MTPLSTIDLARLHASDLTALGDSAEARYRRATREEQPERHPLPPFPRLAIRRVSRIVRSTTHGLHRAADAGR